MTGLNWAIATYLRLRPSSKDDKDFNVEYDIQNVSLDDGSKRSIVELAIPADADPGLVHNNSATGTLRYEFDDVFDQNTTQEHIFNTIAKSRVVDVIDGMNCTIFAYGQTGSGKTYSIFGGDTFKDRGLIPRSVSLMFQTLRDRQKVVEANFQFKCTVSFTEIYKETVYDLLDETKRTTPVESWTAVQVLEAESGIVLRNLNVFEVSSEQETLKLFFLGSSNRITSSTSMNIVSSRSHAVFTLLVETESIRDNRTVFTSGKVNLVDLAGSERMYKMANSAASIKEAKTINLSLHFLEQVILALREQSRQQKAPASSFVPYRNSVLTNILRDSLGGNCRSSFLLTCSVERQHFEETVATCRFGQRCGEVKVKVQANSEIGLSDQLKDLAAKLKNTEAQLSKAEEERDELRAMLRGEQEMRKSQTQTRLLTNSEKSSCTECVQTLLNSARAFVDAQDVLNTSPSALKEASEDVVERSQDVLYRSLEVMDKAVLVELATALGGLVQSFFIELQLSLKEKTVREHQRIQAETLESQRQEYEIRLRDMLISLEDLSLLPRLPDDVVAALTAGAVFMKKDRMGREAPRMVALSRDMTTLSWSAVGGTESSRGSQQAAPLSAYVSVEAEGKGEDGSSFVLRPAPGCAHKALHLSYADTRGGATAREWMRALRYLILKQAPVKSV